MMIDRRIVIPSSERGSPEVGGAAINARKQMLCNISHSLNRFQFGRRVALQPGNRGLTDPSENL